MTWRSQLKRSDLAQCRGSTMTILTSKQSERRSAPCCTTSPRYAHRIRSSPPRRRARRSSTGARRGSAVNNVNDAVRRSVGDPLIESLHTYLVGQVCGIHLVPYVSTVQRRVNQVQMRRHRRLVRTHPATPRRALASCRRRYTPTPTARSSRRE